MKKILILLLCVCSLFVFTACGSKEAEISKFTNLKNEQTLFVGEDAMFKNCVDTEVTDEYLIYEKDVTYTLRRSSTYKTDSVYYEGYYYYWETNIIREEELLGQKTVTTTLVFSYIPFGANNENVVVKRTAKQVTTYNYDGGFIEKDRAYTVYLNGYFESLDELKSLCKDLAVQIDVTENKHYYVDVKTPNETMSTMHEFKDTYFYVEQ